MTLVHRETATLEECATALRRLSDADVRRLEQLARLRAIGLHAVDWRELLHEAIARLLDGTRKWPKQVPLVVFLRETMRSIASVHWRRLERSAVVTGSAMKTDGEMDGSAVEEALDETGEPERRASAAETLERIEDLFGDDDEALCVLAGMASGSSPKEIQEESGMDETRYASTQRRIRRRLAREFPDRREDA